MSMRTAYEQNKFVLVGALLFAGWTALTLLNVANSMGSISTSNWVGQHGIGGIVGIAALLVILAFTLTAYGTLAEPEPAPAEWPPESE
ncbi:hypothetical protein [Haloparvum alkalitolerans]|uniref:hypothetical protein n=1 Tax=Haloparvum alkalitolerans TaxID=1042953 RepID=UPI003CED3D3A